LGSQFEERYRLYFIDNTLHTTQNAAAGDARPVATTRVISYQGALQQALRDLSAWVEKGVAPPPSTQYQVVDGQVQVAASATERRGLQPLVAVKANGSARAEVAVGKSVTFDADIEAPPNTGLIVKAEWDFEGGCEYAVSSEVKSASRAAVQITHTFTQPGTYFPALRVTSSREAAGGSYAQVLNLGRVRVMVT
jgi:hypothetical protein